MPEYIDAAAAKAYVEANYQGDPLLRHLYCTLLDVLPKTEVAEAAPVVCAKWIRMDAHIGMEQFKCSLCRSEYYVPTCMNEPMYDYCPNCGAKMDGEMRND